MDITPEKINVQSEDVRSGAAASEATMNKVGGSVNFWNTYFEGSRLWAANGRYSITPAPENGVDGMYFCWSDCEIYAVGMYNLQAGSAGDTEFDLVIHPVGGGPTVSIFSTRPKIPFSSGNNARVIKTLVPTETALFTSAGATQPIFAVTQLNAGDSISCNFISKQTGGKDCGIVLAIRPR
jgi:hypothetical protein